MSSDPERQSSGARAPADEAAGQPSGQPSEEEVRAAYEAELSRITSADMMLQAAVTLLNIGGLRLGARATGSAGQSGEHAGGSVPGGAERDLEQVRDAIDAVRALLEILARRRPAELTPLRDALSQLQIAYAQEVKATPAGAAPAHDQAVRGEQDLPSADAPAGDLDERADKDGSAADDKRPGPAEASGRLWVPGR